MRNNFLRNIFVFSLIDVEGIVYGMLLFYLRIYVRNFGYF